MGKPACSLRTKLIALVAAGLLACGFAPSISLADDAQDDSVAASFVLADSKGSGEAATPNSAASGNNLDRPTLASTLAGSTTSIVSADVTLDAADPVVGSFTVDGLTYAVGSDGLTLVAVDVAAAPDGTIAIPATITYDGTIYDVVAIGPYAFYLSGATLVELPASIASVDDRAFRSSDVERVTVDAENPNLTSFDDALYSADYSRLLLIPEGRKGSVLLSCETEVVEPSLFSHCSLVEAISVEEGGAAFSSWDGLLYDVSGTTLLRVPAGATEITIRDGCTTIAAGALEGCAKLERINAPASVTSISPDVFQSIPTIALPAQAAMQVESVAGPLAGPGYEGDARSASADSPAEGEAATQPSSQDEASSGVASTLLDQANPSTGFAPQLNAMVAVSAFDAAAAPINPSLITVDCSMADKSFDLSAWERLGFVVNPADAITVESAPTSRVGGQGGSGYATFHLPSGFYFSGRSYPAFNQDPVPGTWSDGEAVTACWYSINDAAVVVFVSPNECGTYMYAHYDETVGLTGTMQIYRTSDGVQASGSWFLDDAYTLPVNGPYYWAASRPPSDFYWCPAPFDVSFDVDSEAKDDDYPGEPKDDEAVSINDGQVEIDDPKRPGYVFEGWVIPNGDGTEAIDQDLVYQGDDGKWYVDASKLPDYAGSDGRVELTARWTAALSVDAPISATFMYDLSAWDGNESRDAFVKGSSTVKNRSAVPIRVSGIESAAGDAASVLKRSDGTTMADAPTGDAAKVLSVFPTTSAVTGTEGDAKGPASDDAADDIAHKVDLSLSDVKLEAAFDKGAWAVDAATVGDNGVTVSTGDLKLGYRLNLGSATGVTLDQDALLAITGEPEGTDASQAAAIANLTYCFAAEGLIPTGTKSDPLWVEVTDPDPEVGSVGVYGLSDIKRAAEDFSSRIDPSTDPNDQDAIYAQLAGSPYFELFRQLLEHDVSFQVKVDGRYLPLQLLGIAQDTKTADGKRAGLTFQMRDIYAYNNTRSTAAGGGAFNYTYMNPSNTNSGGWGSSALRGTLHSAFWGYLPTEVQAAIIPVTKYQQLPNGTTVAYLQKTTDETVWLPSTYEVFGASFAGYNESEALALNGNVPFQYMAYEGNSGSTINSKAVKAYNGATVNLWLRSVQRSSTSLVAQIPPDGSNGSYYPNRTTFGVAPAFCL